MIKFCYLCSFLCSGKYLAESITELDVIDHQTLFTEIPDSFYGVPAHLYPLVITFRKFLIMLDGTLGDSYFLKFREVRELSHEKFGSSGSAFLQTLLTTKEVDFDKFSSFYWPHFNNQITKRLDSSRVFTEIISHIKGGMNFGETCNGNLTRDSYIQLSNSRVSTLTQENREMVYDIFQEYEKMKALNDEFDLADFVNDIHRRLKIVDYSGDQMDFVYIDEVQDLAMEQIAFVMTLYSLEIQHKLLREILVVIVKLLQKTAIMVAEWRVSMVEEAAYSVGETSCDLPGLLHHWRLLDCRSCT